MNQKNDKEFSIEQINNCSCLLPSVELDFVYTDTEGKQNKSTEAIVDYICKDVAAFIGPEGPNCATEAMVAGSKNKAMISYRYVQICAAHSGLPLYLITLLPFYLNSRGTM